MGCCAAVLLQGPINQLQGEFVDAAAGGLAAAQKLIEQLRGELQFNAPGQTQQMGGGGAHCVQASWLTEK
jgi:hypothetical protein